MNSLPRSQTISVENPFKGILTVVGFAMHATYHMTLQATPSQLVFGRDTILPIRFEADWAYIRERKQCLIRLNNERKNRRRRTYNYQPNQQVMVRQEPNRKHGEPLFKGPYTITQVYDNGTVKLARNTRSGGVVHTTWNIRNIHPYTV